MTVDLQKIDEIDPRKFMPEPEIRTFTASTSSRAEIERALGAAVIIDNFTQSANLSNLPPLPEKVLEEIKSYLESVVEVQLCLRKQSYRQSLAFLKKTNAILVDAHDNIRRSLEQAGIILTKDGSLTNNGNIVSVSDQVTIDDRQLLRRAVLTRQLRDVAQALSPLDKDISEADRDSALLKLNTNALRLTTLTQLVQPR